MGKQITTIEELQANLHDPEVQQALSVRLDRFLCPQHFYHFVRMAWRAVYNDEFIDGWHIAALCYHLQALYEGQYKTLIFSMPGGCGKSRVSCVLFSAWVWIREPSCGQWFASYGESLCERDSADTKRLVKSKWFRDRWGQQISIREDEDTKMMYRNDVGGWRLAASIGGSKGFGEHPGVIGIDDCLSPKLAQSAANREVVRDYLRNVISTRGVVRGVKKFLGGQRLHENDGHQCLEEQEPDATKLVLPMWFEEDRRCLTKIRYTDLDAIVLDENGQKKWVVRDEWVDPRTQAGQLMWPQGMDAAKVEILKNGLRRAHAIAGQLQQRPTSPEGDMFLIEWFKDITVDSAPTNFPAGRAWDLASSTSARADETAGALETYDGDLIYIVNICWGKFPREKRNREIRAIAEDDASRFRDYHLRFEYEGGSGGKDAPEMLAESLSDEFRCYIDKALGKPDSNDSTLKGWETLADLLSRGRVRLVKGPWNQRFIEQCLQCPNGAHDDLVDCAARMARSLYQRGKRSKITRPLLLVTPEEELALAAAEDGAMPEFAVQEELASIFDNACAGSDALELGVRW